MGVCGVRKRQRLCPGLQPADGSGSVRGSGKRRENNMTLAEVLVEPEDNAACYYTLTSVRQADRRPW